MSYSVEEIMVILFVVALGCALFISSESDLRTGKTKGAAQSDTFFDWMFYKDRND